MFGGLGMGELVLIFLVVLLVFGAKRIPEIARGLGKGIREFKDATTDLKRELNTDDVAQSRPIQPPQGSTAPRASYEAQPPQQPSQAKEGA